MKWLLLTILFVGPTSNQEVGYKWFESEKDCLEHVNNKPRKFFESKPSYVCIPFGK